KGGVPRATKKLSFNLLKIDATFHLRVLRYRFRPRSIPSLIDKKKRRDEGFYFCCLCIDWYR
ncbi:MAG: hypothetical protein QXX20_07855, partial [Candidatus Thermoplasmatota archaeon]